MKKNRVLYQLSVLEKMIGREFISSIKQKNKILCHAPTPTQMQLMHYFLEHKDEEIYQNDLENILHLRRATVSGVLHTMERHGLIKRVTSKNDARIKQIIFTDEVKNIFDENRAKFLELESAIESGISEEELNAFLNTIDKMQKNIIDYNKKEGKNI